MAKPTSATASAASSRGCFLLARKWLATGGGAFHQPRDARKDPGTRHLDMAARGLAHPDAPRFEARHPPVLKIGDPEATMRDLMAKRYPFYAEADITIDSRDVRTTSSSTKSSLRSKPNSPRFRPPEAGGQPRRRPHPMPTLVHSMTGLTRAEKKTVPVALGNRSYDVLIGPGLLQETGRLIATRIGQGQMRHRH